MAKLKFVEVGKVTADGYVDEELMQSICDEGYRLVTVVGDVQKTIRLGFGMYAIFEKREASAPVMDAILAGDRSATLAPPKRKAGRPRKNK